MKHLVLVSSCLLGKPVRYDGSHKSVSNSILQRWIEEGRVISICPEVVGGLPIPRLPAEIQGEANNTARGQSGVGVLAGLLRVIDSQGNDLSEQFITGAKIALEQAELKGIRVAVLKDGSPSCGSSYIYDGSFAGKQSSGMGVTAALLASAGVRVFSESQFVEADEYLRLGLL